MLKIILDRTSAITRLKLIYFFTLVLNLPLVTFAIGAKISRDANDIHFYLYPFKNSPETYQEIGLDNVESLRRSSFQKGQWTVFLIHGFLVDGSSLMPQDIKNAYLKTNINGNYIVVDWGKLSGAKNRYPDSVIITMTQYAMVSLVNVPTVGQRIANFIEFLVKNNALNSFAQVHLIGHSLGAQIAGQAGFNTQQFYGEIIGRITGLDPAGPFFNTPLITSQMLEKSNAIFVDAIHTNGGNLGSLSENGHVDFYPDGGRKQDVCCSEDKSHTAAARLVVDSVEPLTSIFGFCNLCSHALAFRLYTASFKHDIFGCKCNVFKNEPIFNPICNTNCTEKAILGYKTPVSARGQFGLDLWS